MHGQRRQDSSYVFWGADGNDGVPFPTCEEHGEPPGDVLNLQVQEAVEALESRAGSGVAHVVVEDFGEVGHLAGFQDRLLGVRGRIPPAGRKKTKR